MVDRELPLSGRVPLHLERPPAFVVVALRHLTAQLDNLSDCDHLPNDATGDTEPFEFSDQAFRLVPWSIGTGTSFRQASKTVVASGWGPSSRG